jgi:biotin synthase
LDLTVSDILRWLHEEDEARLAELYRAADAVRRENVGDAVHLRGLIEVSSHCVRQCGYCGLRRDRADLQRYRMGEDEIVACAHQAVQYGYGTAVLQAGEDYGLTREFIAGVVARIKRETPLAVTLSLGERPTADLAAWHEAGADRYLLRFETSDPVLYERIHPTPPNRPTRFEILRTLRELGYEVGSGVMIGIPGQTWASLANDIDLFRELRLDMIGVGPYLQHPDTPLGSGVVSSPDQVPNTEEMTYKVVALTRLVRPDANIPSTTALATLNKRTGRELGLMRGANVIMPNLTPQQYRALYEIYPAKACVGETADACNGCLHARLKLIGRPPGKGPGGSRGAAGHRQRASTVLQTGPVPTAGKCRSLEA